MKYNTENNIAYVKAHIPKDRLEQYNDDILKAFIGYCYDEYVETTSFDSKEDCIEGLLYDYKRENGAKT